MSIPYMMRSSRLSFVIFTWELELHIYIYIVSDAKPGRNAFQEKKHEVLIHHVHPLHDEVLQVLLHNVHLGAGVAYIYIDSDAKPGRNAFQEKKTI